MIFVNNDLLVDGFNEAERKGKVLAVLKRRSTERKNRRALSWQKGRGFPFVVFFLLQIEISFLDKHSESPAFGQKPCGSKGWIYNFSYQIPARITSQDLPLKRKRASHASYSVLKRNETVESRVKAFLFFRSERSIVTQPLSESDHHEGSCSVLKRNETAGKSSESVSFLADPSGAS